MFSNGDKIISRLNISQDVFNKLSDRQVKYIEDILLRPPQPLTAAVTHMSCDKLKAELGYYGIPLHAAEYSFRSVEAFLCQSFKGWRLSTADRTRLLGAIARNSATQIVSIPLLVGLWKGLEDGDGAESEDSAGDVAVNRSIRIVELRYVDIHFVFQLIAERLSTFLRQDKMFVRWEELRRAMVNEEIRLAESLFLTFQRCLVDSGIYLPQPENKVNRLVLSKVCDFFRERSLEEVSSVDVESVQAVGHMTSTVSRLVRSLLPNWTFLRKRLLNDAARGGMVSEEQLLRAVRDVGGIVMSARDMRELWAHAARCSHETDSSGSSVDSLPLAALEGVLAPKESNYSSLSALMRDEHHPAVVRSYKDNPNKEDHLTSLFQEQPNMCTSSPPSLSRPNSVSSFPWQRDEANAISNVKIRVLAGLQRAGPEQQRDFIHALYHNEKHFRNKVLPRGVLQEAFACAGIHLNRRDVQDIWDEAHATLPPPLRVVDLQNWLQLNHVPPPREAEAALRSPPASVRKTTTLADMSYDRHNRRYQAHYAPAWAPLDGSGDSVYDARDHGMGNGWSKSSDSGSREGVLDKPDSSSYEYDAHPGTSSCRDVMTSAQAAEVILANQAHLAYCFRTLSSGGGLVKGRDLVNILTSSPFDLQMRPQDMWAMICGMAGAHTAAPEASVYLRFSDAVRYLESELQKSTLPPADFRLRNITDKLHRSRFVLGHARAMLDQAAILRQRLKYSRQRGPVVTWDGVPDVCSPHEFMSLMNTIDIPLTLDEVEFVYDNVRTLEARERAAFGATGSNDQHCMAYQIEHGFSLGSALKYLSDLLAPQELH